VPKLRSNYESYQYSTFKCTQSDSVVKAKGLGYCSRSLVGLLNYCFKYQSAMWHSHLIVNICLHTPWHQTSLHGSNKYL